MTFVDQANIDPVEAYIRSQMKAAKVKATQSLDANPDDAARAEQVSKSTNIPASIVDTDLKHYDDQLKASIVKSIVGANPTIRDYINNNPLAAKVSNDDYANLDAVTDSLKKFREGNFAWKLFFAPQEFAEGFAKGFGSVWDLGNWVTSTPKGAEFAQRYPYSASLYALLGLPLEMAFRTFGGVIHGTQDTVEDLYTAATGDEQVGKRFARDVAGMFETHMLGFTGARVKFPDVPRPVPRMLSSLDALYRDARREPPPGFDPVLDKIKIEQTQVDAVYVGQTMDLVVQSKTLERSRDSYADFLREAIEGDVGISVDFILNLYGEKAPIPGDGMLGWIPNLIEQVQRASETGGDVRVPIADWLAHTDSAVIKQMQEHVRLREDGLTLTEAKEVESFDLLHGSPRKFEVFSRETIGTGSGGAAYGWGAAYLAEASKVAETYIPGHGFKFIDAATGKEIPKEGALYKVRVRANKEQFLDWDVSLDQQPAGKQILERMDPQLRETLEADLENAGFSGNLDALTGDEFRQLLLRHASDEQLSSIPREVTLKLTPEQQINADVSKYLEELGIPGIKYLDQGSRDVAGLGSEIEALKLSLRDELDPTKVAETEAKIVELQARVGKETRNFVVFDESILQILERNNEPVEKFRQVHRLDPVSDFWDQFEFAAAEKAKAAAPSNKERKELQDYVNDSGLGDRDVISGFVGRSNLGKDVVVYRGYEGDNPLNDKLTSTSLERDWLTDDYSKVAKIQVDKNAPAVRVDDLVDNINFGEQEVLLGDGVLIQTMEPGTYRFVSKEPTPVPEKAKPEKQLELPVEGTTRIEHRPAFEDPKTIGQTKVTQRLYDRLIQQRHNEDVARLQAKLEEAERKRQSKEWKENEPKVRQEVKDEFARRPDLAVDSFFREGQYGGDVLPTRPKLAEDLLTPEQRAAIPNDFQTKTGMRPDDAAAMFGYESADAMLADLARISQELKTSGMRPINYRRRLIALETERRMNERFGVEADLNELMDHVLSETQLNMLHEDILFLAEKTGAEFSITKAKFQQGVLEIFAAMRAKDVKTNVFLHDMARAGRKIEIALLKGDAVEAFRHAPRRQRAFLYSKEAQKFEKLRAQFDRTAKRFRKKQVNGVEQEFTDYIHKLLAEAGLKTDRTYSEIRDAINNHSYGSFEAFVKSKLKDGYEPEVADWLLQGGNIPRVEEMSVQQFREFKDAIDSLNHIGRKAKSFSLSGQEVEFEAFLKKVIDNITTLPKRPEKQGRWLYALDATLVRMEQIVKDLDLRQELGPLFQAVIEPMMAAKATEFDLLTDLSKYFKAVHGDFGHAWQKSLRDTIPQDFIIDPYKEIPYDLTREHLINIMLNWGNRSSIEKFTRGYATELIERAATKEEAAIFEQGVKALIDKHATRQDWAFVERMWGAFKPLRPRTDVVARNTSGVSPKWIEPDPVETPFGTIDGGYWPVSFNKHGSRFGSDITVTKEQAADPNNLFGPQFSRPATSQGHLKERTGYVGPVEIGQSIEHAAGVLQRTIHDIAFREPLIQAYKIFSNKKFRRAFRLHYGTEYEGQLIPWLRRIAHKGAADDGALAFLNNVQRTLRTNLVGHVLPWNPKIILTPETGMVNPKAWAAFEANRSKNVALAKEKSKEIRHLVFNMDRDFRAQMERLIVKQGFSSLQREAVMWGFKPAMKMSQEFRMATFVDMYYKAKAEGRTDHEAAAIADSYVRERHGAASDVDLPTLLNSNETLKSLTTFSTFFNMSYNFRRTIPGQFRRGEYADLLATYLSASIIPALFGAAFFTLLQKDESWFSFLGRSLLLQDFGTMPGVREATSFFLEGYNPRTPLMGFFNATGALSKDVLRMWEGKEPRQPIRHLANIVGLSTGLPLAQAGRLGQFGYDVATGKQRPGRSRHLSRNILHWWNGLIYGRMERAQ